MISETDIWRVASLMLTRYGDAKVESAKRGDEVASEVTLPAWRFGCAALMQSDSSRTQDLWGSALIGTAAHIAHAKGSARLFPTVLNQQNASQHAQSCNRTAGLRLPRRKASAISSTFVCRLKQMSCTSLSSTPPG